MDLNARLQGLGLTLPEPPAAVAEYVPAVRGGGLVFVSGQLPLRNGSLIAEGPVPEAVDLTLAQECARQCVLNGLAAADAALGGDWSGFVRVVRVAVFVDSGPGFALQHKVANGASELLVRIFGDAGRHARAAVGVHGLPVNAPVEVELVIEAR